MRRGPGVLVLLLAWAGLALVAAPSASAGDALLAPASRCPDPALSAPAHVQFNAMLCLHNYARGRIGRGPLRRNLALTRSARVKGLWIKSCGEFSHTACRRSLVSAFGRGGYLYGGWRVAENLAWGSSYLGRARATFALWLGSPGHRENLLRPELRDIGIARLPGLALAHRSGVTLWVAHFGTH
jgi:uncharacterized protein YkwD